MLRKMQIASMTSINDVLCTNAFTASAYFKVYKDQRPSSVIIQGAYLELSFRGTSKTTLSCCDVFVEDVFVYKHNF
jgi:hypothetical protein